jgi:hypothetical protein
MLRMVITLIIFIMSLSLTAQDNTRYYLALHQLKSIVNIDGEDAITSLLKRYDNFSIPCCDDKQKQRYLFDELSMQKWGNSITEFTEMAKLLFSFYDSDYTHKYQYVFNQSLQVMDKLRQEVNLLVKTHHPGYLLNADRLKAEFNGKGVTIAVFDVFDDDLLAKQRKHYNFATIKEIKKFGSPVSLNHGNSVIDIILAIAPSAHILPISADTQFTNEAMKYVRENEDIHIINISRAFLEKDKRLDVKFKKLMHEILKNKLVTKSLGNTGTDLEGEVTALRKSQGLPASGNLFAYDLKLIKQFLEEEQGTDNLLLAINENLMANEIALTATIPGDNISAMMHSYALLADGVYTWSSDNFESGSSFAAPQLAAICALLWQALGDSKNEAQRISLALRETASIRNNQMPQSTGLGFINGDAALSLINLGR